MSVASQPRLSAASWLAQWFVKPTNIGQFAYTLLIIFFPAYFGLALYRAFTHQWRCIDEETIDADDTSRGRYSSSVLVVLFVCAVSLTLQEYIGQRGTFHTWFRSLNQDKYAELYSYVWWSGWRVFGYIVIPSCAIMLMPGQRWRDYHVSFRGFWKHLWIYALMFALIFIPVLIASTWDSFRETYPFYRLAKRSSTDLIAWEALYAVQFLALEFFFRGFLLQGLRRTLGSNAIFVMIVPYCMIHYGKPLPETLGAIGAGILLGTMAMRTRSIWGGVIIHVGVAVTMDMMAMQALK
jgi:membrane protease YdiL (CAAX protease family)